MDWVREYMNCVVVVVVLTAAAAAALMDATVAECGEDI
jgi:hypothetical protein